MTQIDPTLETARSCGRALRVCIHRGASQIGGSCVELESAGRRLVIDLGRPLDAGVDADVPLPAIPGLDGSDSSLAGVVISHGHPDHWGLVEQIHPDVPVYAGEATTRILREARFFTAAGVDLRPRGFLRDREPLRIGPFCLTPYLVDHSAFDAYALGIEARGQTLLYSGDLRGHGSRGHLLDELIRDASSNVDALLLEGTHVREGEQAHVGATTEADVEATVAELCARTGGAVLAAYSPQNVDRLATLYRAARRAGRTFVMDLYAASVAAATRDESVPQADWAGVCVYVTQSQRVKVKRRCEFERVDRVRPRRIFPEQLASRAGELVITFRGSMLAELDRAGCLAEARAVWSLWPGYLRDDDGQKVRAALTARGIQLTVAHGSGHASVADLQRLAAGIAPGRIVPIHTSRPDLYGRRFANVEVHPDGEWWEP